MIGSGLERYRLSRCRRMQRGDRYLLGLEGVLIGRQDAACVSGSNRADERFILGDNRIGRITPFLRPIFSVIGRMQVLDIEAIAPPSGVKYPSNDSTYSSSMR